MDVLSTRLYGGRTKVDRTAERREKFVEAAINLAARGGREAVTVSNACAEARLTTRYFYESFASRERLFAEAFRVVAERLIAAMRKSSSASIAPDPIEAFFATLRQFPGEARVFLVDIDAYGQELADLRRQMASTLSHLITPGVNARVARAGALGALLAMGREWTRGNFSESLEEVVFGARAIAEVAGRAVSLTPEPTILRDAKPR